MPGIGCSQAKVAQARFKLVLKLVLGRVRYVSKIVQAHCGMISILHKKGLCSVFHDSL
jgi:hypothetical protein